MNTICEHGAKKRKLKIVWPSFQPPANKLAIVVYLFTFGSIILYKINAIDIHVWAYFGFYFYLTVAIFLYFH